MSGDTELLIVGHTDAVGTSAYNQDHVDATRHVGGSLPHSRVRGREARACGATVL